MKARRAARLRAAVICVALAVSAFVSATAQAAPNSMDALGDSITRAFNTGCPFYWVDCAMTNSWATGSNTTVNSYYLRLSAAYGPVTRYNDAVSGAKMADLPGQASNAVSHNVQLVGILMGANDACGGSTGVMTSVSSYQSSFQQAMNTLTSGLPNADIRVGSIPDIYQLWVLFHNNSSAVNAWNTFQMCAALLANPTSTAQADVDRRAAFRQRVIDFNSALQTVCAQYARCKFDNNAGFNTQFSTADVSTADYFHPSITGQAHIASVAWGALGY